MVLYKCYQCFKEFKQKSNHTQHMSRKKSCGMVTITEKHTTISTEKNTVICGIKSVICCAYCKKIFSRKDSLVRHQNNVCKIKMSSEEKKTYNDLISEIENLKKQISTISTTKIINKNCNIKTTNNQFNNINVIAFGKEDMSYLTDEQCISIMDNGENCLLKLIEEKNFNKNKPEHNNIFIKNWKTKMVLMFDGEEWKMDKAETRIVDMMKGGTDFLLGKYQDIRDKMNKKTKEKFKVFLKHIEYDVGCHDIDDLETDNLEVVSPFVKNLLDNCKLLLYNERKLGMQYYDKLLK
jgi:hypothetical protein